MHNTYTPEELNELVVKTFEKVANEKNKSVEKIKHFIFDHGNEGSVAKIIRSERWIYFGRSYAANP